MAALFGELEIDGPYDDIADVQETIYINLGAYLEPVSGQNLANGFDRENSPCQRFQRPPIFLKCGLLAVVEQRPWQTSVMPSSLLLGLIADRVLDQHLFGRGEEVSLYSSTSSTASACVL